MPRAPHPAVYQKFLNKIKRCLESIRCRRCRESMLPKSYQVHCKNEHGLDHLVCCVFCEGRETWPSGQKTQNGEHLLECFSRFVARHGTTLPAEPSLPAESESTPHCSERCFEFRSESYKRLATARWSDHDWNECEIKWIAEPLFETNAKSLDPESDDYVKRKYEEAFGADKEKWLALLNDLRFDASSGLDEASDWMRRYLYTSWETNNARHYTWYHLCVRAGYMKSFVEAMKGLDVVAAPHWCVCDGGFGFDNPTIQAKTHHRHSIVAVKNHTKFHNALKKMKFDASGRAPDPTDKKYYSKQIKSANHFAASLVYVSRPRSQCKCKEFLDEDESIDDDVRFLEFLNDDDSRNLQSRERHYVIVKTVGPHALYHLMLLVPCGGIDLLARFSTGSKSVFGMKSRLSIGTRWLLSASEELNVKNCVARFDPSNLQIDAAHSIPDLKEYLQFEKRPFVYWFRDQTFPVAPGDHPPTDRFQEWHVSRRTNTLLNLGNFGGLFFMSRNQARQANDLVKMEKACMEKKNAEHVAEVNELNFEIDRLEVEINLMGNDHEEDKRKMQSAFDAILQDRQSEIDRLSREVVEKNHAIEKLTLENKLELSKMKNEAYEDQLKMYKIENERLKKCKIDYEKCRRELEACRKERINLLERDVTNFRKGLKKCKGGLNEDAFEELVSNCNFLVSEKTKELRMLRQKERRQLERDAKRQRVD